MIDIVEPEFDFSAGLYVKEAKNIINEILLRGKTPIVVGGTGLYISTLTDNILFEDEEDGGSKYISHANYQIMMPHADKDLPSLILDGEMKDGAVLTPKFDKEYDGKIASYAWYVDGNVVSTASTYTVYVNEETCGKQVACRVIFEDGSYAVGPTEIDGETHYFSPKGIEVVLVNALNPVPDWYKLDPVNVVDYHDVDRLCYNALNRMLEDLTAAGIEYTFNSAYRTILEQTTILEYRTREHMEAFGLDFYEARDMAYETVAIPGTSEHHLGLAVDLLGEEAVAWLQKHCWDYGFILRYTEEKEPITGIIDEPWHFRYVGTEVSLDLKDSGLCLEEYLGAEAVNLDKAKALYGEDLYQETVWVPPEERKP